jgi:hypothetical protein
LYVLAYNATGTVVSFFRKYGFTETFTSDNKAANKEVVLFENAPNYMKWIE